MCVPLAAAPTAPPIVLAAEAVASQSPGAACPSSSTIVGGGGGGGPGTHAARIPAPSTRAPSTATASARGLASSPTPLHPRPLAPSPSAMGTDRASHVLWHEAREECESCQLPPGWRLRGARVQSGREPPPRPRRAAMDQPQAPDRNLAMELARVTEAAALAAGRWMGRGDKEAADQAAVDAMRLVVNNVSMDGVVVIGEGEKDEAPMLYNGEQIGSGGPGCDIAVDPIDGTTLTALGRPNAIAVIALSERGTMFDPGPCVYMEKIAVGPEAADPIDLDASVTHNLQAVAKALGEDVDDVTAVILDRDRHADIIKECREAGARIRLIPDGDVAGAISTAWPESGANILFGIGGTPEGVIAACALKCLGGAIQGRLWPRNDDERRPRIDAGYDLTRVLDTEDLVSGDDVFFSATGVTDGELLRGVRYFGDGARTQSLVMRSKSGTIRTIDSRHRWHKLMRYSSVKFD